MKTYRDQSYEHIDKFIGRLYHDVVVGYLDDSLSLFGSITHALVAQGDPNSNRAAHSIPMSRTQSGISIPRDKRKYMIESRAVVLGTKKPGELEGDILSLKDRYRMDGILYMTVLADDGSVADAKYFNHTERTSETPKRPAKAELPDRQEKASA